MDMGFFWALLPSALVMALIGFMEATSISKAIAAQTRERVDTSKELVGQGLANIVGSFFSSFTVSGSFSRSAVAAKNGAKTGCSPSSAPSRDAGAAVPDAAALPPAAGGAGRDRDDGGVRAHQRARPDPRLAIERQEAIVGVVTFAATLAMAPQLANGILLGAGLAIVLFLVRTMAPRTDILGRRRTARWPASAPTTRALGRNFIVVRFDGSLNFVNASRFEDVLLEARAATRGPRPCW
jgi:SulP family sulfate permease